MKFQRLIFDVLILAMFGCSNGTLQYKGADTLGNNSSRPGATSGADGIATNKSENSDKKTATQDSVNGSTGEMGGQPDPAVAPRDVKDPPGLPMVSPPPVVEVTPKPTSPPPVVEVTPKPTSPPPVVEVTPKPTNPPTVEAPPEPKTALFVGNSFTFFNDMPKVFERISRAKGHQMTADAETFPGGSLKMAKDKGAVIKKINENKYDIVVLQAWYNQVNVLDDMKQAGIEFADAAKKRNPNVKVLMYMTHMYSPLENPKPDSPSIHPTFSSQMQAIYEQISKDRTWMVNVPVQWAWEQGLREQPNVSTWVYSQDMWHPNNRRSYIAAVMFYATAYHDSPVGVSKDYLNDSDAKYLQNLTLPMLKKYSTDPFWKTK